MIQISSIPLTESLIESIEVHILVLRLQRTIEQDSGKQELLSERISIQEKLLQDFKHALNRMKDDKG